MSERASVWVIEEGSYSDYHVVGVFSSRQAAEMVLAKMSGGYDEPTIAEWALDPGVEEIRAGLSMFHVTMAADGTTERCEEVEWSGYAIRSAGLSAWHRTKAPAWRGQPVQDAVHGRVFARDIAHAVKIANERRIQLLADGQLDTRT